MRRPGPGETRLYNMSCGGSYEFFEPLEAFVVRTRHRIPRKRLSLGSKGFLVDGRYLFGGNFRSTVVSQ
jgi:hypothetical protein